MVEIPNLVSLNVKCPVCGHSLMDEKRLVDNCPSIKLHIHLGEDQGVIHLSSVWESYNYISSIEIPKKEVLQLSCPHCNSLLKGRANCEICDAPMFPLDLELGGDVCLCSRMGCKNHFVKLVDLSFGLKQLYSEKKVPESEEEEKAELMRSGTFLMSYCPDCRKTLIEDHLVKLRIDRGDKTGFIMLSPYLNVFTSKSTIRLPEDENLKDIKCPHCDVSLMMQEQDCEECGSATARILVGAAGRLMDFYICSRKGCTWHGLSREDMNDIRLEQSLEW